MFFANSERDTLRRQYITAWQRHRSGAVLEPLEAQIAAVIAIHPEYHLMLESAEALLQPFNVEQGQTNPFLHMGLHLAIREQLSTQRPAGITSVHQRLTRTSGDAHAAEHKMIEVLAETLWEAQRAGRAPDEQLYLERLRRL
jgi:Domain of unknown function (DUF1841)